MFVVLMLVGNNDRRCLLQQFQKDDNGMVEAVKIQAVAETYGLQALLPQAVVPNTISTIMVISTSCAVRLPVGQHVHIPNL